MFFSPFNCYNHSEIIMESFKLLTTLFPLSLASGINLYATSFVVGLCIRMGWVQDFPPALHIFSTTPVLIFSGFMFLMEFFADKIQFLDNLWDTIHTIIRPLGAAIIVLASFYDIDPLLAVLGGLAGGGVSFISHTAKAGTRASVNIISPFENISNITISFIEDFFVAILSFMAMKHPYITASIALIIFVILIILIPRFLKWLKFLILSIFIKLGFAEKKTESETLPAKHILLLAHKDPVLSIKCKAQGVPKAGGRTGYLSLYEDFISFSYSKFFKLSNKIWVIDKNLINRVYLRKKFFVDLLELHYKNKKGKNKICRFVFFKNREKLLEKFYSYLSSGKFK